MTLFKTTKGKSDNYQTMEENQGPSADNGNSEKSGWVSPAYSESRKVELDPEVLEKNRIVSIHGDIPEVEHYRMLRTQIQQRIKEKGWNTVMITSAHPGEGKTLTAINLAIALAKEFDQTALLIDCDLKRQAIHKYLGYASEVGIVDYLLNDRPMKDLITWPGIEKLTIISGGRTIQNSTELLGSPKMKQLISEMKSRYDDRTIIFDVPPILARSDPVAFAPFIEGILVVVEAGKTPLPDIKSALGFISPEKFLGFVLNRIKEGRKPYGYY